MSVARAGFIVRVSWVSRLLQAVDSLVSAPYFSGRSGDAALKQLKHLLLLGVVVAAPAAAQSTAPAAGERITQDDPAYKAAFEETLRKPGDPVVLVRYADLANRAGNLEGAISAL